MEVHRQDASLDDENYKDLGHVQISISHCDGSATFWTFPSACLLVEGRMFGSLLGEVRGGEVEKGFSRLCFPLPDCHLCFSPPKRYARTHTLPLIRSRHLNALQAFTTNNIVRAPSTQKKQSLLRSFFVSSLPSTRCSEKSGAHACHGPPP